LAIVARMICSDSTVQSGRFPNLIMQIIPFMIVRNFWNSTVEHLAMKLAIFYL